MRGGKPGTATSQFKISKPYHYCEKTRAYHKIITLLSLAKVWYIEYYQGREVEKKTPRKKATSLIYRA